MKRIILIFGVLSGLLSSALMILNVYLIRAGIVDFDNGELVGYTGIVLAFVLVFFGVRAYRESLGGVVTFGRAFLVGLLIVLLSSVFYVVSWQVIYFNFMPDFMEKWTAHIVQNMREKGESPEKIEAKRREMADFKKSYDNPLINAAFTFIEPFPVGLIAALVSAAVLRRKAELVVPSP